MRIYDVVMTHALDTDDFFIHQVQRHCAEKSLNFFLIEPLWAPLFLDKLEKREVWARVLINMHSEHHLPEDVYHRLVRRAHEQNTQVIDPPDRALAAFDKAALHPRLVEAGFKVPDTIVVSREEAAHFKFTEEHRKLVGNSFIVKPSLGYGRKGLVFDAADERDLARSVAAWANPAWLLQRRIIPKFIGDCPIYFRVYYVFDSLWYCWWNCFTDRYRMVTPEEFEQHRLEPLTRIMRDLARLTGMNFFSSEITQTEEGDFVLIDYVNDQCHMLSQSSNAKIGVPDEVVAGVAKALVEASARMVATQVGKAVNSAA